MKLDGETALRRKDGKVSRRVSAGADFQEFGTTGTRQHLTANADGVLIRAVHVDRMVGHATARQLGEMLIAASERAKTCGAEERLMESA